MTKKLFGITINSKPELNTALIKEEMGHIPNSEIDLFKTEFITTESVKQGSEMAKNLFAKMNKNYSEENPA